MGKTTLQECLDHGATIEAFKDRTIDLTKPVRVYRNLHAKVYSIKQGGRVVAHATRLALMDCRFIVNEKGRQRVIAQKRKNVHAFIEGTLTPFIEGTLTPSGMGTDPEHHAKGRKLPVKVSYNPYKAGTFVSGASKETPLKRAEVCMFDETGVYAAYTY